MELLYGVPSITSLFKVVDAEPGGYININSLKSTVSNNSLYGVLSTKESKDGECSNLVPISMARCIPALLAPSRRFVQLAVGRKPIGQGMPLQHRQNCVGGSEPVCWQLAGAVFANFMFLHLQGLILRLVCFHFRSVWYPAIPLSDPSKWIAIYSI